jgi:hypothetical protein
MKGQAGFRVNIRQHHSEPLRLRSINREAGGAQAVDDRTTAEPVGVTAGQSTNADVIITQELAEDSPLLEEDEHGLAVDDVPIAAKLDIEEVKDVLRTKLDKARINGISKRGLKRLKKLVLHRYVDVFRTRLTADPPAKFKPLHIDVKPGFVPPRAKPIRLGRESEQRAFLQAQLEEMVFWGTTHGCIFSACASRYRALCQLGRSGYTFPRVYARSKRMSVANECTRDTYTYIVNQYTYLYTSPYS